MRNNWILTRAEVILLIASVMLMGVVPSGRRPSDETAGLADHSLVKLTPAEQRWCQHQPLGCVYRKPKHERIGDEVRPGWRVN
jgi:hypothetical protein